MLTKVLPSHVLAVESLRKSPFSGMLGCVESERIAMRIVTWLAEFGDSWATDITNEWECFGSEWELSHDHPDGTRCRFIDKCSADTEGRRINDLFVRLVTRKADGRQFRDDVLRRLIPAWPFTEEPPCP